ncbi:MAG: hypothetical protein M1541_20915, partial [Acidobacteria bacterium]|nr:hypothetical protein [Acidobacteriota bacterium]
MRQALKLILALIPTLCAGAITNTRVLGTTATQAVLAYTAPTTSPCTLEVSESSAYSPAINDVDTTKFAGANLDTRAGNISGGVSRIFVIGKRAAERGLDGKFHSRALQADTVHYYRITCGADTATGSFRTSNIPLGGTYPDPFPVDSDRPGEYAWPTMDQAGGINERIVDPQTGALVKRLTGGGSFGSNTPYTNLPNLGAFDDSDFANRWSITGATLPANYTADGTAAPKLYVPLDPSSITQLTPRPYDDAYQMDYVTLRVTGSATAAGEDAKVQLCLTVDGVSCAPETNVAEADLTACGPGCTVGDTVPVMNLWTGGKAAT